MAFKRHHFQPDSPTNNFATLNPLQKDSSISLSEGNLKSYNSSATHSNVLSTLRADGQNIFYAECTPSIQLTGGNAGAFYWARDNFVVQNTHPESDNSGAWGFYCSSGPSVYANGDNLFANFDDDADEAIIQLVYNSSTGEGWVGINNTFYNCQAEQGKGGGFYLGNRNHNSSFISMNLLNNKARLLTVLNVSECFGPNISS